MKCPEIGKPRFAVSGALYWTTVANVLGKNRCLGAPKAFQDCGKSSAVARVGGGTFRALFALTLRRAFLYANIVLPGRDLALTVFLVDLLSIRHAGEPPLIISTVAVLSFRLL